jgi:hypothetical protein
MAEIIKQTAIEYLRKIFQNDMIKLYDPIIWKQAKEMEIHQILNAYTEGVEEENKMDVFNDHPQHWACEYSDRTYGNIYGREK